MRLNLYQIKNLGKLIVSEFESSGLTLPKDEAEITKIVEAIIVDDLKKEDELEKEAKHTANIHTGDLDYEVLVKRAKYELAKKKGIKL